MPICGLGASVGYERVSEHSTLAPRPQIGIAYSLVSVCLPIRKKGDTNVIIQKKTLDWKDRASLFR